MQEQGEKMGNMFLEQAPWLPEEGRKAVTDWINAYKTGRDKFKDTVESNFDKVTTFFSTGNTE